MTDPGPPRADIVVNPVASLPRLAFDHREVVNLAQLQQLHEAVAGIDFPKAPSAATWNRSSH